MKRWMPEGPKEAVPSRRKDSGQSTVEGAIVLPAMVFLVLTIIQLTMIQHARIMTEYAAFCAVRAGIVFNGDPVAMERAATVALLPTMGRTDTFGAFETAQARVLGAEVQQRTPYQLPVVAVEIRAPTTADFNGVALHTNGQEIDFDDIRAQNGRNAVQANILQIRLHYYYKMRVPFANQLLQAIFFAQHAKQLRNWDKGFDMSRPESNTINNVIATSHGAFKSTGGNWNNGDKNLVPDYVKIAAASDKKLFYFPLQATYSMRMQSNFLLSNAQQ